MAMDFMPPVVVRLVADIKDFQGKVAAAEAQMGAASTSMGRSFNLMGAAAGVAGLAIAGLAAKLAIDGVQAAIEDEKAVAKLTQTMTNLGLAHDVAPVESMIDAMQRQTGVADDKLRPAMEVLLRATKDTAEAQSLLKVAMDVSAGTGKDLESVTQSLAKAANGQTTALRRMVPELDDSVLKSGNLNVITAELSRTFQGQAQKAANTYEGQIKRLGVGFDELKESIGYGFLNALNNTQSATNDLMQSFKDLEPAAAAFGKSLGESVRDLTTVVRLTTMLTGQLDKLNVQLEGTDTAFGSLLPKLDYLPTPLRNAITAFKALGLWLDYNTGSVEAGTKAWGDYWAAASGSGYSPATSIPEPPKPEQVGGRDWAAFYGVNPSSQKALADARSKSQELLKQYVSDMRGPSGVGGASVKEEMKPIGISIVDGLIEGLNISGKNLPEAAQRQLDRLVQGFNSAVQDSRAFMEQIGKSLVDSLNLSDAADEAAKTGANIVDVFVEQSKKVKAFGENMIKLAQAGLNETSWQQIYDQGAVNGAKIADALIKGNMAENVARVNDAVGSVTSMGDKVALAAMTQYKQIGIDNATSMLENFIGKIMPDSKEYKKLMKALDDLAAASNRTSVHRIVTVTESAGGASGGSTAIPAITAPATPVTQTLEDWFSKTYPGVPTGNFYGGIATFATGGWVSRTGPALVHQKEFVLSRDMLEGRQPVPDSVRGAVAGRSGTNITVNAQTNADPVAISREIAWNLRVGVI